MFEISELKTKKLTDLLAIAKTIGLAKVSQLKKLDLVYKILDAQAESSANEAKSIEEKPKRKRIAKTEETEKQPEVKLADKVKVEAKEEKTEVAEMVVKKEVEAVEKSQGNKNRSCC